MNPKSGDLRSSAKDEHHVFGPIHLESDNECPVPYLNSDSDAELEAEERTRWAFDGPERAVIQARFWNKVNKNGPTVTHVSGLGPCWVWTASTIGGGYGQFTYRDQDRIQHHAYAHRFAYELTFGPIPNGLILCHRCDVRACCNPDHVFIGTDADNLADAREKGRLDESLPRVRKLTPEQRLDIFNTPHAPGIGVSLAQRYDVSEACISKIRQGRFKRPLARDLQKGAA